MSQIKSKWTQEMSDDLMNLGKSIIYKFEDVSEIEIVKKFFSVTRVTEKCVFYSILSKQDRRKIKLLILKQDEYSEIIKKILEKSKIVTDPFIQDIKDYLLNYK